MALPTIDDLKGDIVEALQVMLDKQKRVEQNLKVLLGSGVRIEELREFCGKYLGERFEWSTAMVERSNDYNSERIEWLAKEYNLSLHRCQKLVE